MQAITTEQRAVLESKGYTVEDVGAVWGDDYAGQFRFMFKGDQDFGEMFDSAEKAWSDAQQYQEQLDSRAAVEQSEQWEDALVHENKEDGIFIRLQRSSVLNLHRTVWEQPGGEDERMNSVPSDLGLAFKRYMTLIQEDMDEIVANLGA